ncbi:MAG TPA: GNAT family N-acetyltransferase [Rhizomicrobium sp.]|nr:GNAT family N-acetyltransferase [Rhizomicrobium sp.]
MRRRGAVRGFCRSEAHVCARPEALGQGVADAIMAHLVAQTRDAGLPVLRLETGIKSFAALRFYRRSGFRDRPAFEPYASLPPHRIAASAFLERTMP